MTTTAPEVTAAEENTWDDLDRDLSFHPATTVRPKRLTQEQISFFNENGYLLGLPVYSHKQILEIRRYFDAAIEMMQNAGKESYQIRKWQGQSQVIWDIASNPIVLDYIEDLIGPNIVAWGTQLFAKMPGEGRPVSWHQDASYWPLTPARSVTLWLAIDDSDRENGCMRVIPKTHDLGHLDFDMAGKDENSVLPQKIKNAEGYGEPVDFELKAGNISLHADMLVHGSEPNHSTRRRCALTIRYADAAVKALHEDWNKNSILVRGEDKDGNWADLPRPEHDLVQLEAQG